MAQFTTILQPYSQLTDAMSMELKVGICELYPLLLKIQAFSDQPIEHDDLTEDQIKEAVEMRKKIWEYMDNRYIFTVYISRLLGSCSSKKLFFY